MTTKEEPSFIQKLVNVQSGLKAPKGQFNKFGGYKYRSCEDILEALKPLLAQNGLVLMLTDEPVMCGDWHYIRAEATVTDGSKEYTAKAYAREAITKKGMDDSQITGTASSYARKYALNGLFLIDDTKDADATNQHGKEANESGSKPTNTNGGASTPPKKQAPAYDPQKWAARIVELEAKCLEAGYRSEDIEAQLTQAYGTCQPYKMTKEQQEACGRYLNDLLKAVKENQ